MLKGFEIENFRTFRHVRIDWLGRVNLIVGRNNVGKTMLLEALRLYVDGAQPATVARLLVTRHEVTGVGAPSRRGPEVKLRLEALFHGRPMPLRPDDAIHLLDPTAAASGLHLDVRTIPKHETLRVIRGETRFNKGVVFDVSELSEFGLNALRSGWPLAAPAFVPAGRMSGTHVGWLWDCVALTAHEANVLSALRVVTPLEGIALVADPGAYREGERIVMARMTSDAEPVPLASVGDGMLRVFEIALAVELAASPTKHSRAMPMTGAADDPAGAIFAIDAIDEPMLLIDEIETGIHFTALPDVWRFIFTVARTRGLQVFATTHSWDCIEAFQQAAADEPEGSAMLMRLEQKGEEHGAVLFDQDELPIITKRHIEIR